MILTPSGLRSIQFRKEGIAFHDPSLCQLLGAHLNGCANSINLGLPQHNLVLQQLDALAGGLVATILDAKRQKLGVLRCKRNDDILSPGQSVINQFGQWSSQSHCHDRWPLGQPA